MEARFLNAEEIAQLEKQNCYAPDWRRIRVGEDFSPEKVLHTSFFGDVYLAGWNTDYIEADGYRHQTGLRNVQLWNSEIGLNCAVSDVGCIENTELRENVILDQVHFLGVTKHTAFGNGTILETLNEGGGRELMIFADLDAQLAYLLVQYQHDETLQKRLRQLVGEKIPQYALDRGVVGEGTKITRCNTIENVIIGPECRINGAAYLSNGTILSEKTASTMIGAEVIAKDFIIQQGSKVTDGAILDKCFVGQNVKIGKQYSAENCAFFANSEAFHGEGVALFAGPYTVTHHKSTLLIAAQFSFFNAGSGTNQSNHMYKLGPLHQGILERGAKTGSFSYLLFPSRVGAFSVVTGKHSNNFDGSELPFSYITEEGGKSMATPAMNLFTVGTRRDSDKWPKRDGRHGEKKYDRIHFSLFNPYTIGKVLAGQEILRSLGENKKAEWVSWRGLSIKRLLLKTTAKYYEIAVKVFIGDMILRMLEKTAGFDGLKALPVDGEAFGTWRDILGIFAPEAKVEKMLQEIADGRLNSLEAIKQRLDALYENYDADAWSWTTDLISKRLNKPWSDVSKEELAALLKEWQTNKVKLNNMILKDAEKEFDQNSRIGFGVDGDAAVRDADFEAIRGTFDDNSFVKALRKENAVCEKELEKALNLLG
jgi:hypothetical protein